MVFVVSLVSIFQVLYQLRQIHGIAAFEKDLVGRSQFLSDSFGQLFKLVFLVIFDKVMDSSWRVDFLA